MITLFAAMFWGSFVTTPPRPLYVGQADGKAIYNANCRKCHGVTGVPSAKMKGQLKKLPTLDQKFVSTRSMHDVVEAITKGKGEMKGLKAKLSPAEIDATAKYVFVLAKAQPHGSNVEK